MDNFQDIFQDFQISQQNINLNILQLYQLYVGISIDSHIDQHDFNAISKSTDINHLFRYSYSSEFHTTIIFKRYQNPTFRIPTFYSDEGRNFFLTFYQRINALSQSTKTFKMRGLTNSVYQLLLQIYDDGYITCNISSEICQNLSQLEYLMISNRFNKSHLINFFTSIQNKSQFYKQFNIHVFYSDDYHDYQYLFQDIHTTCDQHNQHPPPISLIFNFSNQTSQISKISLQQSNQHILVHDFQHFYDTFDDLNAIF